MSKDPLVYCITLNWNRREETLVCLRSLERLKFPNKHILVVDNASADRSQEAITIKYPEVELIVNSENLGFGAGFNVGLRRALEAQADFAFIVNNDAQAAPDMLDILVAAATSQEAGITAPVIYYSAHPDRVWSAGAGRSSLTLELTGDHGRRSPPQESTEVEFVSGCAMLIRREVLEQVGVFDERFFLYYEDSDYCLRVRQHGYKILVDPKAVVWHDASVSSGGSDSPSERYWMARSSVLYFRKQIRGLRWGIIAPWRFGSTLKTTTRLIATGRRVSALAYLRGTLDGLRSSGSV